MTEPMGRKIKAHAIAAAAAITFVAVCFICTTWPAVGAVLAGMVGVMVVVLIYVAALHASKDDGR